jgi:two-component system sensor histidine kinase KdpD
VVEDVLSETRLETRAEAYAQEGIRALFICPLQTPDETLGTVVFYYRSPHAFSELEVRVGVALANLAAASLTAASLFDANELAREALTRANIELSATAAELRVANAAKDEFLGLVSHELKTPLTTVRGNAEILLRAFERLDADSRTGALTDILGESERLQRIIENLLLLARTERRDPSDIEPVLVRQAVRKVVERHRRRHPERRFDLVELVEPTPVLCSEACIEQVIDNFLSNAEKYSPLGAAVTVAMRRDGDEFSVDVIDAGDGIDPGDNERLFEPFYRGERSRGRAEGLGIGLAVCKRLVEAYGGRIWARERDGGGAVFGFSFPVLDDPGAAE